MPHTSISKPMFVTNVKTAGGGRDLAKGELAIVKDKAGANGAIVVSDFAGMSKKERIEIRVGASRPSATGLRTPQVAFQSTGFFTLDSIIEIKAYAPTVTELAVDVLEIGFGGISTDKGLFIEEGKSAVMDIVIGGYAASMFFGTDRHVITKRVARKEGQTMQEVIRQLVKDLKEESVPTGMNGAFASVTDNLSNYLNISVIDSTNVALTGTAWTTSTVTVPDAGESNDLAEVQVKYPLQKVFKVARANGKTTYGILHLVATTLADLVITEVDVTGKGCESCQAGYSLLAGGVVYNVALEDDGVTQVAKVQALPGAVAGTALKIGNDLGKGTYSVVLDNALTQAEVTAFLATDAITATAELRNLGDVIAVCSLTTTETYPWVAGDTCNAKTEAYSIVLPDNECGESRLVELQTAYPQLTIAEGAAAGCKRSYTTTVPTNIVCDECDEIFLDAFYGEAPIEHDGVAWEQTPVVYNADAKMGIRISGKPFTLIPEDYEIDFIPFIETSTHILGASFGVREEDYLNFVPEYDVDTEFANVRRIAYAKDVKNLSQSYRGAEEMGRIHYQGDTQYKANLFTRATMNQESLLKIQKRMAQYHVKIQDTRLSQMGGNRSNITHDAMIVVEQGKHQPIETMLNKLAGKLGLENVSITN